eukprot:m.156344 g.156344  ORF g.156344 m.156344 type:complete len:991 (+) comp30988_c0_seq1:126-3098(+)
MNMHAMFVVAAVVLTHLLPVAAIVKIQTCSQEQPSQAWEFHEGWISQPDTNNCLTVSNVSQVQNAPALDVFACGGFPNQTWELLPTGQISQVGVNNQCLDVAGYGASPLSPLHVWACTQVPLPPNHPPGQTAANQQWTWEPDGSVRSLLSGLCLDSDASRVTKPCEMFPLNTTSVCNTSLTPDERAALLIASANLSTMIKNLGVGTAKGFPAKGIPNPSFGEALHGVCCSCGTPSTSNNTAQFTSTGCATSFPHALSMGSTFNRTLWQMVGNVVGLEARALYNEGGCHLAFFAPNVNLYRDPRWGRGMEVPGEDPTATGEYGRLFVSAMQARSPDGRRQRVVTSPKHWLDYDLEGRKDRPSQVGPSRNEFNANVSKQQQLEYYLAAWHATVKSGEPSSVMCSTNRVNGVDSCMNPTYLTGFLRNIFNFSGYVVTDGNSCGNPNCEATVARYNASAGWGEEGHEIAAQLCLQAGTDIELGTTLPDYTLGAILQGKISMAAVTQSNQRLFREMIRSGFLDKTELDTLGPDAVDTATHRQIAFEAATDAMVLLKNDGDLLPLTSDTPRSGGMDAYVGGGGGGGGGLGGRRGGGGNDSGDGGSGGRPKLKIALIGPHVNSTIDLLSSTGYAGQNLFVENNSPQAAFARLAASPSSPFEIVGVAAGCDIVAGCNATDLDAVTTAANAADVVLAFVGLHPSSGANTYPGMGLACSEGESWDRIEIDLCGSQPAILLAAHATGKPLVTILINGGTISASWIKNYSTAVLEAWYPGQSGGEAIAAVVFGERPPTGRLPVTIYDNTVTQARNITNMDLRDAGGLTYMHYRGTPLWPYGFGLAYTNWTMQILPTSMTMTTSTSALASDYNAYYSARTTTQLPFPPSRWLNVTVTNSGARMSGVVVQVFAIGVSTPPAGSLPRALRQLVGFDRVADVKPGETRVVSVEIIPNALCRVDSNGYQWAEASTWVLSATTDGVHFVNSSLTILGDAVQVLAWPKD